MFKLYTNKSSVLKNRTRHTQGGVCDLAPKKIKWWDRFEIPSDSTDIQFVITKKYEFKPYLLAYDFYGNSDVEWLILQFNKIVDIMEEFTVGTVLLLPSPSRVNSSIMIKTPPSQSNITV